MQFENKHLLWLLALVVVVAVAYWWYSGMGGPVAHAPATPSSATIGQLIDKYNRLVSDNGFTDALLRPSRDNLEKTLPSAFIGVIQSADDNIKTNAGAVIDEMSRVVSTIPSLGVNGVDAQRTLAAAHTKAMSALKSKNSSDLGAAVDALRRVAPPPPPPPPR